MKYITGLFLYFLSCVSISYSQTSTDEVTALGSIDMAVKLDAMFHPKAYPYSTDVKRISIKSNLLGNSNLSSRPNNPILSAVFTRISGSMDIFGNLYTNTKPLQYHPQLKTITFIHRKSYTYNPSSNGNSGSIVAMINKNFSSVWDSSCVWTSTLNIAHVPQGGLYNPLGNSNASNSYIVATGSTKSGTLFTGGFYSSKPTGTIGTNSPGADQQFFSNLPPYGSSTSPALAKHDEPQYGFVSTDDGIVRTAGMLYNDINGTTESVKGLRGAIITKGVFTSGQMVWTNDTLLPPTVLKTNGAKQLWSQPYLAMNPTGTVGYLVLIGSRQGSTGSNVGWQPLIYKTTNSGNTWILVNAINFNSTAFDFVLNSVTGVSTNTTLKVPFFNPYEGIDVTMDSNNDLHLVSTILSTAKVHQDSLTYVQQFVKNGESYSWPYTTKKWPYIFDFIGDGINWSYKVVDSVATEAPSNVPSMPGFTNNPWANQGQTIPVTSSMRIQVARDYYGCGLVYSWAESDTTLTTDSHKWNEFPNVYVKAYRTCNNSVSADKYKISSPSTGFNAKVRDKAYFHHLSPMVNYFSNLFSSTATYTLPVTVSNNDVTDGSVPIRHFYSNSTVTFSLSTSPCSNNSCFIVKVEENFAEKLKFSVFPNPFNSNLNIKFSLTQEANLVLDVYNLVGQKFVTEKIIANSGANSYEIKQTNNLTAGVYLIKLKLPQGDVVVKVVKD